MRAKKCCPKAGPSVVLRNRVWKGSYITCRWYAKQGQLCKPADRSDWDVVLDPPKLSERPRVSTNRRQASYDRDHGCQQVAKQPGVWSNTNLPHYWVLGANATWREKRDVCNGSWEWLLTCPHWVLVPASLAGHIRGTWGRHRLVRQPSRAPFLPGSGAEVPTDAYWDCPAGNFRCFCPWARTPLWLRRNRKQNLTLSASLLVPGRGTGGLQSGVTLRRSGRPLKLCGSTGQGDQREP